MFGSGKSDRGGKKPRNTRIDTLVGKNTEVHGDLRFSGGLHIDGTVKGNVSASDDDSVISLSKHGLVEGEVRVSHIVLDGTVTGDVYAAERVELAANAKVNGNVYYNLIEMAVGASVNGKLVHKPAGAPMLLDHKGAKSERRDPEARENAKEGAKESDGRSERDDRAAGNS